MPDLISPCGCVNEIDPEWGIEKSKSKCDYHRSKGGKTGLEHYRDMCAIDSRGIPQHKRYGEELHFALDELGEIDVCQDTFGTVFALEVGAGLGMYAPYLMQRGFRYEAIEPDKEAASWIENNFDVLVFRGYLEDFQAAFKYGLIIAAHVFEHLKDAPAGIKKCFDMLSSGGRLILIVPNNDDPVNPDHLWMFTESTLASTLSRIGFKDIRMVSKQVVKHEKFIYCTAVKL